MKTLYKYKAHHILLWLGYFAFWYFFARSYYPTPIAVALVVFAYFLFNASAFYVVGYVFVPKLLYRRKVLQFVFLSLAAALLFSGLLAVVLFALFSHYFPVAGVSYAAVFMTSLMSNFTTTGILSAVKLIIDKVRSDGAVQRQEKQQLESELQYLKAQVNPHFLFNAINSVYFLIKKDPDVAAETLIKLSDLLRFQLYDCSDDKIAIEKEMEYLHNFVALEKIRKGEKTKVELSIGENVSGFSIAPFLLIPFMENAFKHVTAEAGGEKQIKIAFARNGNNFSAHFFNSSAHPQAYEVGGIGLKNVKRRLELLYPGKHTLAVKEENDAYAVDLTITFAE